MSKTNDELDKQLDKIDFVSVMRVQNEVPGYGSERIVEIRLKLEDKAKAAIKQLIDKECTKARIDELQTMLSTDKANGFGNAGLERRLAELTKDTK